jgi:hypothetical protein
MDGCKYMSDDRDPSDVIGRSGDIDVGGDANIGGDVVGRDKLVNMIAADQVSGDKVTTIDQRGQQVDHQINVAGDYVAPPRACRGKTALAYLKQSLAIWQQIGDKAGLCVTLFNMGHIHAQNNQMQDAAGAWVTAYLIAKPMRLAQVLQALAQLAPQLGLPEGLAGWERLARQSQHTSSG